MSCVRADNGLPYSTFCTCSRICSISTLKLKRRLRQLGIHRFRPERICFAMKFLHQEVEPFASAAAGLENASHTLDYMSRKPLHFFRHVDLGCEQGEFLLQPLVVGIEPGLFQARPELVGKGSVEHRNARRDACDLQARSQRSALPALRRALRLRACAMLRAPRAPWRRDRERAWRAFPVRPLAPRAPRCRGGSSATDNGTASGTCRCTSAAARARCPTRSEDTASEAAPAVGRLSEIRHSTLPRFNSEFSRSRSEDSSPRSSSGKANRNIEVSMIDAAQVDREGDAGQSGQQPRSRSRAEDHGLFCAVFMHVFWIYWWLGIAENVCVITLGASRASPLAHELRAFLWDTP